MAAWSIYPLHPRFPHLTSPYSSLVSTSPLDFPTLVILLYCRILARSELGDLALPYTPVWENTSDGVSIQCVMERLDGLPRRSIITS